MAYTRNYTSKVNWKDYPNIETPLAARNLDKMDQAILDHDLALVQMDANKVEAQDIATMVADFSLNETTGVITVTYKNGTTTTYNTNLTKISQGFSYNSSTQQIEITAVDGTVSYVDISDFITETEFQNSNTIAFTVTNHVVTASIRAGSVTESMLENNFLQNCRSAESGAVGAKNAAETAAAGIESKYQDVISAAQTSSANASQTAADRAQTGADVTQSETNAFSAARSALDAQAWAEGKRGSVDIPNTDPAYNKYAKHWADVASNHADQAAHYGTQAETSATQASGYADRAGQYQSWASDYADEASGSATSANQAATAALNSSRDAEAWAVGKRNGVDVPQSDPAWHNDAYFWARQAQAIVGGQDNVKYTAQNDKTEAEKAIARANIGASSVSIEHDDVAWTSSMGLNDLADGIYHIRGESEFNYTGHFPENWSCDFNYLIKQSRYYEDEDYTASYYTLFGYNFGPEAYVWYAYQEDNIDVETYHWASTSQDIPIATTSVAGKVKPDGVSIKVDSNGKIQDYGNAMVEETEIFSSVSHISDFTNGWHSMNDQSHLDYSELPVTEEQVTAQGNPASWSWIYVMHDSTYNPSVGDMIYAVFLWRYTNRIDYPDFDSEADLLTTKMWILPFFEVTQSVHPRASDWIEIDNKTIGSLSEKNEEHTVNHLWEFSNGWHRLTGFVDKPYYSELPPDIDDETFQNLGSGWLHITKEEYYRYGYWFMAELVFPDAVYAGGYRYLLPFAQTGQFNRNMWIEVDNLVNSDNFATRFNSISRPVKIQSTAPSDTTALWVK